MVLYTKISFKTILLRQIYVHKFKVTQRVYDSVTWALRAALLVRYSYLLPLAAASYQSSLWISLRCFTAR